MKKGGDALNWSTNICFNFYNGKGDTIYIKDSFFSNSAPTCRESESEFEGMSIDFEINNGEQNYQISQLEVYKIIFE